MTGSFGIDLTTAARRWNRLQIACVIALIVAMDHIATILIDSVRRLMGSRLLGAFDESVIAYNVITVALAGFVAIRTWRYSATFTDLAMRKLRTAFLAIAVWAALLLVGFGLQAVVAANHPQGAEHFDARIFGLLFVFVPIVLIFAVWTLLTIRYLREGKLDGGLSFRNIMATVAQHAVEEPKEAAWHVRLDQPLGVLWIVAGIVIFMLGAGVYSYLFDKWLVDNSPGNPLALGNISTAVQIFGAWCLIKGRSYFLPRAEAVLAIDRRAPILYLRSFLDEKPTFVSRGWWSGLRIDRSLEMKLSKYFQTFGPFVAIGSPSDAIPKQGALRLMRSDQEWQAEVAALQASSRWLVASVGLSSWIKWELSEIAAKGHLSKALFLLPPEKKPDRIAALAACLGEAERAALTELREPDNLLACVLVAGRIVFFSSRKPTSNAQVLAAIVGHYLLIEWNQALARNRSGTPAE